MLVRYAHIQVHVLLISVPVLVHVHHPAPAPCRAPAFPCHAVSAPGHASAEAVAPAVLLQAAVFAPGVPGRTVEGRVGAAAAVVSQADRDAEHPDAVDFSSQVLPAFHGEPAQAVSVLPAAESADGQTCRVAGNGIARCAVNVAVPREDSGHLHSDAGRRAAERVPVQLCDSTGPIPFYAVPIHVPSADPSEAVH